MNFVICFRGFCCVVIFLVDSWICWVGYYFSRRVEFVVLVQVQCVYICL